MRSDLLTAAQQGALAEARAAWEAAALVASPADRPRAEQAIRLAYTAAGLPPPRSVAWARSPLEAALALTHQAATGERVAEVLREVYRELVGWRGGDPVGRLWSGPLPPNGDPLAAFLARTAMDDRRTRAAVGSNILAGPDSEARQRLAPALREEVGRKLRDAIRDRVVRLVWEQLVDEIHTRAWARLKAQLEARRSTHWGWLRRWAVISDLYGAVAMQDALHGPLQDRARLDWLALYDFCASALGLSEPPAALAGLIDLARSAGWWWPRGCDVVLCERPVRLLRDDAGQLHSDEGPAIVYPDGWAIWAWHGVRVPRRVIERPEALTEAEVRTEPDPEVRRIMNERAARA